MWQDERGVVAAGDDAPHERPARFRVTFSATEDERRRAAPERGRGSKVLLRFLATRCSSVGHREAKTAVGGPVSAGKNAFSGAKI